MHKPCILSPKNIRVIAVELVDRFTMKGEKKNEIETEIEKASREDTERIMVFDEGLD